MRSDPARRDFTDATSGVDGRDHLRIATNSLIATTEFEGRRHVAAGQAWRRREEALGRTAPALTALVALWAIGAAFARRRQSGIAVLAMVVAPVVAARYAMRSSGRASTHESKGDAYLALRSDAKDFVEVDLSSPMDISELDERHRDLSERLRKLS
jgi:hypothetical protein